MNISIPISIITAKSGKGKRYYLNLNNYRNWHYQTSNAIKTKYCESLESILKDVKLSTPIELHFILWNGSKRKIDRANIISIVEKNLCDALTHYKCIEDDSDDYISSSHYITGGIDKENPRCDVIIIENK